MLASKITLAASQGARYTSVCHSGLLQTMLGVIVVIERGAGEKAMVVDFLEHFTRLPESTFLDVLGYSRRRALGVPPALSTYLSDLKPARTSSEKSCGCSQAAKCPPLSSLL